MTGFITIILEPTRLFTEYGVVDLEKRTLICRSSCDRDADLITDALNEARLKRLEAPKALLGAGE